MKKSMSKEVFDLVTLNHGDWLRNKFVKPVSQKIGLAPGTLVHVGRKKVKKVILSIIDYSEQHLTEKTLKKIEESFPFKDSPSTTWLDVRGLHEMRNVEQIGQHFAIHPLVQEDVINTGQRPTFDDYEDYLFIALKMLYFNNKSDEIEPEHISLIIGQNFVITFQEREGDIFDPLRERIRVGKGRIRKAGSDYLGYAIIDIVVDNYFLVLEAMGDKIQQLEELVNKNPSNVVLNKIYKLKRELIYLRKAIWPLREVVNKIEKSETKLIKKSNRLFFRDVYDHTIQVIDTVESYRDMASGLQDLYLSQVSNKMNEIMKVLTIFAAIFIPLTFVAGVYGMNFEYIPELAWPYGYFAVWGVFIVVGLGMLAFFRSRKWL